MKRGELGFCCSKCGVSICDCYGNRIIELEKDNEKSKEQLAAYIKIDQHACCKQRDRFREALKLISLYESCHGDKWPADIAKEALEQPR